MYPRPFAYIRAESVEHAVTALASQGAEAQILAGGASIIPLMKIRMRSPKMLVDIGDLAAELQFIDVVDGTVRVGALVKHADAMVHPAFRAQPLLAKVAAVIADVQVRNMGTIVGGICAVEPTGDWIPALIALGGSVVARSPEGEREITVDDLIVGPFTTSLRPDELVTEVRFPAKSARSGAAHEKLTIRANAGIVNCTVAVTVDDHGVITAAGIAIGALESRPFRAVSAERALVGTRALPEELEQAALMAVAGATPMNDSRGDSEFRRAAAATLLGRATAAAYEEAMGR